MKKHSTKFGLIQEREYRVSVDDSIDESGRKVVDVVIGVLINVETPSEK
jgi:hypothetical protein